jgi:hypothetical protein
LHVVRQCTGDQAGRWRITVGGAIFPRGVVAKSPEMLGTYVEKLYADEHFQATRREMQTPRRSPEEFCRAVVAEVKRGKNVAIADVAFVNGSDLILGMQLIQHPEISQLAAYGGWNTAGNALGTVLAQAAIYTLVQSKG